MRIIDISNDILSAEVYEGDPVPELISLASLKNGDEVQVIKSAGDGWYEITFTGSGGKDTSGYMKGDYLTNS